MSTPRDLRRVAFFDIDTQRDLPYITGLSCWKHRRAKLICSVYQVKLFPLNIIAIRAEHLSALVNPPHSLVDVIFLGFDHKNQFSV